MRTHLSNAHIRNRNLFFCLLAVLSHVEVCETNNELVFISLKFLQTIDVVDISKIDLSILFILMMKINSLCLVAFLCNNFFFLFFRIMSHFFFIIEFSFSFFTLWFGQHFETVSFNGRFEHIHFSLLILICVVHTM